MTNQAKKDNYSAFIIFLLFIGIPLLYIPFIKTVSSRGAEGLCLAVYISVAVFYFIGCKISLLISAINSWLFKDLKYSKFWPISVRSLFLAVIIIFWANRFQILGHYGVQATKSDAFPLIFSFFIGALHGEISHYILAPIKYYKRFKRKD